MWTKQLVLAFLLVEVFLPWPRFGILPVDLVILPSKCWWCSCSLGSSMS